MTLVIDVEFLHGTFRADPDGLAHTGRMTRGEWPPSPARVFAALIAADGTGDRCRVTDGSELELLERLDPPVIHADPLPVLDDELHQVLQTRYVVKQDRTAAKATHQEYVGRTGVAVHPGVRVCPRTPFVRYVYSAELPPESVEAIRRRAARVGYLGTADSPVRVRVANEVPEGEIGGEFTPDPHGDLAIAVPREGHLQVWDAMHDAWLRHGVAVGRAQFPALRNHVAYRSPSGPVNDSERGHVVAWLCLRSERTGRRAWISGRRMAAVTSLFKKALLVRYQQMFGDPPAVLHGHEDRGRGYELARFLALPDVGYRHSRGRIHGLALWMPPADSPETSHCAREAARSISRLVGPGVDIAVVPWGGEERPVAANPKRWRASSRAWATAFPAIHERHGPLTLNELARWCAHAGLPEPVKFRADRHPLVDGAVDLSPVEVHRPGRPRRPYSHVEVVFAEPVAGPVVIGAGRQRGFGLCVPVRDRSEEPEEAVDDG
ncbi:MAG: type I-U CRISPR-associated protein Cas5/Cas6 [Acidimicrobiia bacterium]|nr:type I-U CRISPR-associated protein Cas5/Cas6 [Acidimicrobiia bacterium]MYB24743.1 type I-U CRISPR-associated protein Cas5/Cas6 [Acidimicrobiia bacterium]MYJ13962.1 type I-U CRISPR-associated protein Cas5/Cas6 [Acidimicrobiia bacterium]